MAGLSIDRATVRARELKALELRKQGYSYQEISDQVGWNDPESARAAIMRMFRNAITDNLDEIRATEIARLDEMWKKNWPNIEMGDPKGIEVGLKIMAARRRYIGGLEVPETLDVTGNISASIGDVIALQERLALRMANDYIEGEVVGDDES